VKIYVAGPDVFLPPDGIEVGRLKVAICNRYGVSGLSLVRRDAADVSIPIFEGSGCVANFTLSRVGRTRHGARQALLGYSNDPSIYADRVRQFTELTPRDGRLNRCGRIDLMMIHGLEPNGCALAATRAVAGRSLARPDCVRDLRAVCGRPRLAALIV
jgi:hypothetical protein